MERIKAIFRPETHEQADATIIDVFFNKDKEVTNCEVLWVDNDGNLLHHPIRFFRVDMDSFTGRAEKQKTSALVEMLYHAFVQAKE